jgi:hypothetical protein
MERISLLLGVIVVGIVVLILGGLLSDRVTLVVRRFAPRFWFDGELYLLWGLLVWTAFAMGLVVMYVLLR